MTQFLPNIKSQKVCNKLTASCQVAALLLNNDSQSIPTQHRLKIDVAMGVFGT